MQALACISLKTTEKNGETNDYLDRHISVAEHRRSAVVENSQMQEIVVLDSMVQLLGSLQSSVLSQFKDQAFVARAEVESVGCCVREGIGIGHVEFEYCVSW